MSGKDPKDPIQRGDKGPSPLGTTTFIGLRALDPLLQYSILAPSLSYGSPIITSLGGSTLVQGAVSNTGIAVIDRLGLSPSRAILLGMATAATVKHILWGGLISEERLLPSTATKVSAANVIFNGATSLLFVCAATSPAKASGEGPSSSGWPPANLVAGSALFVVGILTELVAEVQRKAFKRKPENQGKVYRGGLFGLARHINYGAFTLWRTGFALAGGGWIFGAAVGALCTINFSREAIPSLDGYCEQRVYFSPAPAPSNMLLTNLVVR